MMAYTSSKLDRGVNIVAEPVIITWNFTNWVTIVLMALLGFMVFGLVVNGFMRIKSKNAQTTGA